MGSAAEVCSATRFTELARDRQRCGQRRLAGDAASLPRAAQVLRETQGTVLAISDYVRTLPEQIPAWLPPGRP